MLSLKDRQKIRESYEQNMDWIIKEYPKRDPYAIFNWCAHFTPIEYNVWHDIRCLCLPMYPEFPVENYFIDFADPVKKIGVEVDGKDWHKNIIKDRKRQNELENLGWKIFRIPGVLTFSDRDSFFEDYKFGYDKEADYKKEKEFRNLCSEGILQGIKDEHYS